MLPRSATRFLANSFGGIATSTPCFTRFSAHAILNIVLPEWRNWQTQQTQNLPGITPRVGSTPSSGTTVLPGTLVLSSS